MSPVTDILLYWMCQQHFNVVVVHVGTSLNYYICSLKFRPKVSNIVGGAPNKGPPDKYSCRAERVRENKTKP